VNPALFVSNIGKFVKEVPQVDYLNLFINSLCEDERGGKELEFMRPQSDEELIRREHAEFISTQINGDASSWESKKINSICEALKE
jgi:hypothetical protein